MPIPTGGAWPPPAHAPAYDAYREWDAWQVGTPAALEAVYQGRDSTGQTLPPSQRTRASQYAGGLIGRMSRWLWGTPAPTYSRDGRLHVPLPADLTATAAALLFSEPPLLSSENAGAQARLEELVDDGLIGLLRHAAEAGSLLGDVYLRPVIDQEVDATRAIPTVVHADGALPTLRWGRLVEVTFWSQLAGSGNTVIRLLEHHDVVNGAGRITYALYEGTPHELGRQVPLAEHSDAEYLAELVDADGSQATGLDRLDVVRIPNAGPQRRWRTTAGLKYLGRSDLDGNEPIFDRVDAVWTSWMRDIHLARGRITVPAYMLESQGPGQGAVWDADREVYSAVNAMPTQGGGSDITVSQFAIRHVEHKATIDALAEVAMRHAGLSSQTLGEEGDVAMTATEAQSRERLSFTTRGDRIAAWTPLLGEYLELHLTVEKLQLGGKADPVRPDIEWGDSVSESPEATARTLQLLAAAEAVSTETKVRMVHPDWNDKQVQTEVVLIEEASAPVPVENPETFTGAPPDTGSAPRPAEEEPPAGE